MKAIQITQTGGPEVLNYIDVDEPIADENQALVDIQAIGVNYTDVYTRSGVTPSNLPVIPGNEASGIVTWVGSAVSEVEVGDLVAYTGVGSSYAETVAAPSWRLVKLPDTLDAESGAASMLQGMTAHYLVHSTYPLGPGDTCLVHAAAGGVGLLLTQMAKSLGSTVIGTVSTAEKGKLAYGAGADYVINYSESDFQKEVMDISDGKGIQVVYDAVGLTTFEKSIGCLDQRGYMVLYGQASGHVPPINPSILGSKSLFLTRPSLVAHTSTRKELLQRANDVLGWVADNTLNLRIHNTFQLSDAEEAHRQLEGRISTGKIIMKP